MISFLQHFIGWIIDSFRARQNLILEDLALRQQLLPLHGKRPRRRLSIVNKLFWVTLLRVWSGWKQSLVVVTPRTVIAWHRAGFALYWSWLSRADWVGGRRRVNEEIRLSSPAWRRRVRLGEHREFTVTCSSWDSPFPNRLFHDGFGEFEKPQIQASAG